MAAESITVDDFIAQLNLHKLDGFDRVGIVDGSDSFDIGEITRTSGMIEISASDTGIGAASRRVSELEDEVDELESQIAKLQTPKYHVT